MVDNLTFPKANVHIMLFDSEGHLAGHVVTTTWGSYNFEFRNLPAGSYTLQFPSAQTCSGPPSQTVEVKAGQTTFVMPCVK